MLRFRANLTIPPGFTSARQVMTEELARGLREAAMEVQAGAMRAAPFRTGNLRRSIGSTVAPFGAGMKGIVFAAAPYARYVEEGTGVFGPAGRPITPRSARVLAWTDRDGQKHFARSVRGMQGRFFMRQAFIEKREAAIERLRAAVARIAKRLGSG